MPQSEYATINTLRGLKRMVKRSGIAQALRAIDFYRQSTSKFRAMPHFIIIGAMKSGTSSLYSYLSQHPKILPSTKKEVHFFDYNFDKGELWYRAHFPFKKDVSKDAVIGEASPLYLYHPIVPERIHTMVPNAKLIAILRNPTERAISHYFHEIRKKREPLPIMEALLAEEQRMQKPQKEKDYNSLPYVHFSYKKRGIYLEQITNYRKIFPLEKLLVLSSDALFQEPHATLKKVFRFLEVDENVVINDLSPRNIGRNRTKVPLEVYDYLDDYFRPYNQELYEKLGENFGW